MGGKGQGRGRQGGVELVIIGGGEGGVGQRGNNCGGGEGEIM